jgi:integrase/recombinase XerC
MSAMLEERFTLSEWSRIVSDPTRDNAYQRITRLGGPVRDYLAWKTPSASGRTLTIYEGYLAALCSYLAQHHGNPDLIGVDATMLLHGANQHPAGSYKLVRTAYRDFFQWAEDEELVDKSPAKRMPKSRPQQTKVYDIFTPAEQAQLVKAADYLPLPWVQRLRVLAFIDLGIRSEEARLMQPRDIDPVSRTVVVRGKGEKERVVPFSDDFFRAFVGYRNRPIPNVRMTDERGRYRDARPPLDTDFLFFPLGYVKASGSVTWADPFRPLASRAMRSWWDKVVATAGVTYRSLHMNRHTLGTNLSDAGEGLETIQDWLGHADPSTSKVYVHNSRNRLNRGRNRLDEYRKAQGS